MHKETIGSTEFTFRALEASESLDEVYRLRYQVYCKECNFIKEEDHPNGIEQDKFDPHSVHFVAEDAQGVIGTARIILNSQYGFPLEEHCNGNLTIDKASIPREQSAEISRLVISKSYRRRRADGLYYTPEYEDSPTGNNPEDLMRRIKPMAFGLYREMYQESKRRGINHWFALMEKSLWLLLRLHGFIFDSIGSEIDMYGPVKPYLAKFEKMEQEVRQKFPHLYTYFLDGLELKLQPSIV